MNISYPIKKITANQQNSNIHSRKITNFGDLDSNPQN